MALSGVVSAAEEIVEIRQRNLAVRIAMALAGKEVK